MAKRPAKPTAQSRSQTMVGNGGKTHQTASAPDRRFTTDHGVPVSDNQNSFKAGSRGPSLLEYFVPREKIQHFDHERIPERIVHARGSARGYLRNVDESLVQPVADGLAIGLPAASKAAVAPQDMDDFPAPRIVGKYEPTLDGRAIGILVTDGADGRLVEALRKAAEAEGATVKIVAPKIGGVTLKRGKKTKADGQLAGTPSVVFDAVALVVSVDGCAALMKDGAAMDFVTYAFGHLKVIGHTAEAQPLLDKAGVTTDDGVVDLASGADAFLEPAMTRQWDRERNVRVLV